MIAHVGALALGGSAKAGLIFRLLEGSNARISWLLSELARERAPHLRTGLVCAARGYAAGAKG